MRLLSLQLTRYGPFADERIVFDARPGCINLLCAPNGAGKSVLRQAFGDLLFGIPGQTEMGFRYEYKGMRLMAEALGGDGNRLTFGRRKGQGNTLIDATGNPVEASMLTRLLGAADRALLERLFALDTERLREGGKALLASGGALAEALLSGGGLRGARALRQSLEATVDSLAPAKKVGQRPFYRALDALKDARNRANAALVRPDDWHRMERALAEATSRQAAQNQAAAEQAKRMAQWQRIRRVRAPMAAHDAASTWLRANPDSPVLGPSLADRLTDAAKKLAIASDQLEEGRHRAAQLAAEHDAITIDAKLLDAADSIELLSEHAGAVTKALVDLPQRAAELAAVCARITQLVARLNTALPVQEAATLIPHRAAESRARALIAQHGAVAAAMEQAPAALAHAAAEIAEAEAERAALPPDEASALLPPLIAEIRAEGDPTARAEEIARAETESRAALAASLAAVPGWSDDAVSLIALTLPPPALFERLEAAKRAAAAEGARHRERHKDAATRHTQTRQRLAAIISGGVVADEAAIASARAHRDRGWDLIYRLAFTGAPPDAAEQTRFTGGQPLPLAYSSAVQQADALADQRVVQADRIAQAAEASRAESAAAAEVDAALRDLCSAEQYETATAQAWAEACCALPLGASPGIEEIRSFLAARDRVIDRQSAAARDQAAHHRLHARHAAWTERLRHALDIAEPHSLATLLAEAETRIAAAAERARTRAALAARLRELHKRQQTTTAAAQEAARRMAAWQNDWAQALAALGRPANEHPGVTADILAVLHELEKELETRSKLAERLADMQADNEAFAEAVDALLARVAPDMPLGATAEDRLSALRLLSGRLKEHRDRATRQSELHKQVEQTARQVSQIEHRKRLAAAELDAVLTAIGAESIEGAEQRLAAAAARTAHERALEQAAGALVAHGDGLTLDELRSELAIGSADDVAAALQVAETAMLAAQEAAQEAASVAARLRLQMEQLADDGGYAAAVADQQEAVATLGRVLEEALLARVAALLLERAMEAMEAQGGAAVLGRIGAYVHTLTGGAYPRIVSSEGDDGKMTIQLVPADRPDEHKPVDALSEGTRDQLFLALRLAAIEDHVASAPPLPFIGDDILQTSDDARARCALQALVALSQHVQVIVLTHHQHVVGLASALPQAHVHVCQISRQAA